MPPEAIPGTVHQIEEVAVDFSVVARRVQRGIVAAIRHKILEAFVAPQVRT